MASLCLFQTISTFASPPLEINAPPPETTAHKLKDAQPLEGRVFLRNGDKLRGNAIHLHSSQQLDFESAALQEHTSFPTEKIIALKLAENTLTKSEKTLARIKINNRYNQAYGDIIIGYLKELTEEQITLDTSYAGVISINRSMVSSFTLTGHKAGAFYGPNSMNEWLPPHPKNSWTLKDGSLSSQHSHSIIGKDLTLQGSSHISFDLSFDTTFRLSLMLFSDQPTSLNPSFGCEITLNQSYADLSLKGNAIDQRLANNGNFKKNYNKGIANNQAKIDIFTDAKQGLYRIYIDDQAAAIIQAPPLEVDESRGGFSFINDHARAIKIKNISIEPWSGNLPSTDEDVAESAAPHNITLNNGDKINGTLGKISDDTILIETEYTPIRVPTERIRSFDLENSGVQPIMKEGDVLLSLLNGGRITLQPTSITKETITGYGQAFGDLELDLSEVHRIDFNIYDDSLENDRSFTY